VFNKNTIVIKREEQPVKLGVNKQTQKVTASGTVTNKNNQPLIGVSIQEKGTTNGTVTDVNGVFNFTVANSSSVLIFKYLGFLNKEMAVSSNPLTVVLEEDPVALEDVVIVGYGTQKKENLTGAISTVTGTDLAKRPVMRASAALQGLAPGLTITQRSGQPGSDGGTIRIRGVGTFGDSNPLVLIDGVEGSLDGVDANDIASISVLKDA